MHPYIQPLVKVFEAHADETKVEAMERYMLNQFKFYGIKAPLRQELTRAHVKIYGLPDRKELQRVIRSLWLQPQRELQHAAMDLAFRSKKQLDQDFVKTIEYMVLNKSWWDTVDMIASNIAGPLFAKFPELVAQYPDKWIRSDNMWLQRTAILYQLKYKDATDTKRLFSYIQICIDSQEFFIRKAIGWVLREYSKTDAETVKNYVGSVKLSPLSHREALKWLNAHEIKS